MRKIIIKCTEPHGWVIAKSISEKYPGAILVNYSNNSNAGFLCVPINTDIIKFKEAIEYWLNTRFNDRQYLLILTESTENENKELINMLDTISSDKYCIVICNDFMMRYFQK